MMKKYILKIIFEKEFSKGLQFLVLNSHIKMRINKTPIKIKVDKDACPFFIKRIRSAIIAMVINSSARLPVVSLFFSLYFKESLPTIKGKRMMPHAIRRSNFSPSKKASRQLENEYWSGAKW